MKKTAAPAAEVETTEKKSEDVLYFKHRKPVLIAFGAVVLVCFICLGYAHFIYQPRCEEAQAAMFPAENIFQQGLFETALDGDETTVGFSQIIEDYGSKAGQSVYLYAGICALKLERYDDAIAYLKQYKGKDEILSARASGCLGDAYVAQENYKEAVKMFNAAADRADNVFAAGYLVKAGLVYEKLGDADAALKCYKKVKEFYPMSMEAREIDNYINSLKGE